VSLRPPEAFRPSRGHRPSQETRNAVLAATGRISGPSRVLPGINREYRPLSLSGFPYSPRPGYPRAVLPFKALLMRPSHCRAVSTS
jgi:hypothetical protein